jgi:hypothetical protein
MPRPANIVSQMLEIVCDRRREAEARLWLSKEGFLRRNDAVSCTVFVWTTAHDTPETLGKVKTVSIAERCSDNTDGPPRLREQGA